MLFSCQSVPWPVLSHSQGSQSWPGPGSTPLLHLPPNTNKEQQPPPHTESFIFSAEIPGPGAIKLLWEKLGPQRLRRAFSPHSHLRAILLIRNRPKLPALLSITRGQGKHTPQEAENLNQKALDPTPSFHEKWGKECLH